MQAKASPEQIDAALDAVALKQLTWKPSTMRNIAIKICVRALHEDDRIFWADDIDLSFVEPGDRNCIGMAWRMLVKAGIVKRTDLNRRSTNEASKGRIVFKYRLASAVRAQTFLKRNGWTGNITAKGERLLFPMEEMDGVKLAQPEPIRGPKLGPRDGAGGPEYSLEEPPPALTEDDLKARVNQKLGATVRSDAKSPEPAKIEHGDNCMCHLCLPGSRLDDSQK